MFKRIYAGIIETLNQNLSDSSLMGMFASVSFIVFNIKERICEIINAGHPPAILLRNKKTLSAGDSGHYPPVGVLPDIKYECHRIKFERKDVFLLYTDGIMEARGLTGQELGINGLSEELSKAAKEKDPLNTLLKSVELFADQSGIQDDLTAVYIDIL